MSVRYGVGLGSSGARALAYIDAALRSFSSMKELSLLAASERYGSPPAGGVTEAPFVNAAVLVESALSPSALLYLLRANEQRFGRVRGARYGGRSLDLDLLWSSGAPVAREDLVVPHPRLEERAFALVPLLECFERARLPAPLPLVRRARSHGLAALRHLPAAA